ncbi:putative 2-oxoglutarate-dependent dioxygenase FG08081 [[Candida] railenensis]|uniref:2-oxoglutarate-dependent dioxygenase FG08081 n=1 Tax=[Candida] railenensis TaxID=45579 RepID=A0A9P0QTB7_9ASCO|nr:putative 2-oxoglutarate-dependent dioxygenase FG08081 [[Candida] railenensis]
MTISSPEWKTPKETSFDLDWANLTVIDLSKFDDVQGRKELVQELGEAVKKDGFWAAVGTGISEEEINDQFKLGSKFFSDYELDDKSRQLVNFEEGNYFGYKPKDIKTVFGTDVKDNVETLNIAKFTKAGDYDEYFKQNYIHDYREQLELVSRRSWEVARKLLILFALILELDENYFVLKHLYDEPSDDHLRYMKYHPRSEEDDAKVDNIWARGHTDFGSLTLLYNQLVAGLQIQVGDGSWKYVKPVKGGIICNIGDTLSFWSGGYFKSTIHRVVRPPPDQINAPRIGSFYFVRPAGLISIADSPLLRRLGLYKETKPITGTEYVRSRVKNYHDLPNYERKTDATFKHGDFEIRDGF